MMPIQDLLNRITWDAAFGRADFVIGYYDRIAHRLLTVSYRDMQLASNDHFAFTLVDRAGAMHRIPFHRVKAVYRNNELIWHRGAVPDFRQSP
jgi:uncharacterized protein (UPF0248 family)